MKVFTHFTYKWENTSKNRAVNKLHNALGRIFYSSAPSFLGPMSRSGMLIPVLEDLSC